MAVLTISVRGPSLYVIFSRIKTVHTLKKLKIMKRGRGAMAGAPDCLASHACVPGSNPAVPVWEAEKQHCFFLFSVTR